MRGVAPPEALLAAAKELGYTRLGLCDVNGFYGLIWSLQEARAQGLELLVGVELRHGGRRAAALALSPEGYRELSRLVTALHRDPDFSLPVALRHLSAQAALLVDDPALLDELRERPETYAAIGPGGFSFYRAAKQRGLPVVAAWPTMYLHDDHPLVMRLVRAKIGRASCRERV